MTSGLGVDIPSSKASYSDSFFHELANEIHYCYSTDMLLNINQDAQEKTEMRGQAPPGRQNERSCPGWYGLPTFWFQAFAWPS